ncbi:hypothetical protein ACFOON_16205 [Novosphingobium piscinae]|uniref:Lipoprotein n=1 Tax=Novosphingobium piscinae TaxID=1507448 RepID=A0A7X1KPA5_9SPHN|nr:hypothetical protein [Novosphingobium piscinae]MBC2668561.1 hypothetical protein [Novosphingobium piscinae]
MPQSTRRAPWHAALALFAFAGLSAGCITIRTLDDGVARARLGESLRTGPVTLIPDQLVEDSRCPDGVSCVQAGTVRVAVRIGDRPAEVALDRPLAVAGGTLALVEAYPLPRDKVRRYPDEYRFGFRWSPQPPPAGSGQAARD